MTNRNECECTCHTERYGGWEYFEDLEGEQCCFCDHFIVKPPEWEGESTLRPQPGHTIEISATIRIYPGSSVRAGQTGC